MIWPEFQTVAQSWVERFLNSLPEGLLIASFAWVILRLLPRQNSGTRFAVWLAAMFAVIVLPFFGGSAAHISLPASAAARPMVSLSPGWGMLLFTVWISAAGFALIRVTIGLWRVHLLRNSCVEMKLATLDPLLAGTLADFRRLRPVRLATSGLVNVPSAVGFFRPFIVLPDWALRELSSEDLNIILLHEFAHLRRWDDWTNLLQKFVRAIFVFHPAVWWIENRLSLEREMACDDLVLAETGNPRGYAKCLIGLLEKNLSRRSLAMAQAAVHRAQEASIRVAQILDASRPQSKNVWKPALVCVGLFSVVCIAIAPHTPQLVAFEPRSLTISQSLPRNAADFQSHLIGAAVIPATLQATSSTMPQSAPKPRLHRIVRTAHSTTAPASPPAVVASANPSRLLHAANANAKTLAQPTETLLMIRTTQRTGSDSWTWSVYVWRLTWTAPASDSSMKAPVAHKT